MDYDEDIELLSKIVRARTKKRILRSLKNQTKTAIEISNELNIARSNAYTLIGQLIDLKLVYCINKEQKRNKLYAASPCGVKLIICIDDEGMCGFYGC